LAGGAFGRRPDGRDEAQRLLLSPLRLAADEARAADIAFRRVRANLDREMGWLRDGLATVELRADDVAVAPMHKLLKPDNRGHTFYCED
jgi:hypothetical protein